ncbi:MAG: hypothetical protein EBT09_09230 [Actinobacteria bacterium]|nr:hypothetical protein [Actinomycetota bacterium]
MIEMKDVLVLVREFLEELQALSDQEYDRACDQLTLELFTDTVSVVEIIEVSEADNVAAEENEA